MAGRYCETSQYVAVGASGRFISHLDRPGVGTRKSYSLQRLTPSDILLPISPILTTHCISLNSLSFRTLPLPIKF